MINKNRTFSRAGFTLVELMISIALLSLIMLFLYKALETLQKSNTFYGDKLERIDDKERIKKIFFLDFSLLTPGSYTNERVEKEIDRVFFQTTHSIPHRHHPYVAYIITEGHLYRAESKTKLSYPLSSYTDMDIDDFGMVKEFKIYRDKNHFLLHTSLNSAELLIKIRQLNDE